MDKRSISLHREDFSERIGAQIKRLKDKRKLTQKEFAEKIGTSQGNIPRILRGDQPIKLTTLAKAAKALGITIRVTFIDDQQEVT